MTRKILILLFINILSCSTIFADKANENYTGITVGANFDPYFLSPGVKLGYRINEYMGVHALAQYTSSDDASNIPAEKSIAPEGGKNRWSLYKYTNLFTSLVFDVYPLENGLKISGGLGYMDRKLNLKKGDQEITNANKMVILASVGYEGRFFEDQPFGYDIEAGVKYLDNELESKDVKAPGKADRKIVPAINIALTYSF